MARTSKTKAPPALSGISVSELQAEITRRQRGVSRLVAKRDRLLSTIKALDAEIIEAGGTPGGGFGRTRAKNSMNLVQALQKALDGKTMSVTEVAEAVQRQGYKTTSASFRTIVNQTLINSGQFKRMDRGQYTAK